MKHFVEGIEAAPPPWAPAIADSAADSDGLERENHVIALQQLIYARFSAVEEPVEQISQDSEKFERRVVALSRYAGIGLFVVALGGLAALIL